MILMIYLEKIKNEKDFRLHCRISHLEYKYILFYDAFGQRCISYTFNMNNEKLWE